MITKNNKIMKIQDLINSGANVAVTIMMIIQTIATIFSGIDYMRGIKKYMKD